MISLHAIYIHNFCYQWELRMMTWIVVALNTRGHRLAFHTANCKQSLALLIY